MNDEHVVVLLDEAASEYVWGVKNPGRVANQYLRRYGMKIKRSKLEKMIMEEARKLLREQTDDPDVAMAQMMTRYFNRGRRRYPMGGDQPFTLDTSLADPPSAEQTPTAATATTGTSPPTWADRLRALPAEAVVRIDALMRDPGWDGNIHALIDAEEARLTGSDGSSSGGGGGGSRRSAREDATGLEQKAGQHAAATAAAPLEFRGATGQFTPWAIGQHQADPGSIAGDHNEDGIIDLRDIDAALADADAAPGTLRYQELMGLADQMGYRRMDDRAGWAETEYTRGQTRADQPSWRARSAQAKGIPGFYGVTGTEPPSPAQLRQQRAAQEYASEYNVPPGWGGVAPVVRATTGYEQALGGETRPETPARGGAAGSAELPEGPIGFVGTTSQGTRTSQMQPVEPDDSRIRGRGEEPVERPANYDPTQGELRGWLSEGVNRRIERMIEREINKVYGKLR